LQNTSLKSAVVRAHLQDGAHVFIKIWNVGSSLDDAVRWRCLLSTSACSC
jgi:hypothetical protein